MMDFSIYRDPKLAKKHFMELKNLATKPWSIMEVCGGQTRTIVKYGLQKHLPPNIQLIHGPGCPVCVTPVEKLDLAHEISLKKDVIFCTYGDMLRVPGSYTDLMKQKALGADVKTIYSPLEAVGHAEDNPNKTVVLFALGFETTAPANAMAISLARKKNLKNFKALVSHVLVPPAMEAITTAQDNRVQAFLAPGHVCSVVGIEQYEDFCQKYKVPIVITGFEPNDLLAGIKSAINQLENGDFRVDNQYSRIVRKDGNQASLSVIEDVFQVCDRTWRGIGVIPSSGLELRQKYYDFDAETYFSFDRVKGEECGECISGEILKGVKKPMDCPHFGSKCTPNNPLGATMVSSEGACSSYYLYDHNAQEQNER